MTNLTTKDFVLFAGIGYLAYWLLRKPKAININPEIQKMFEGDDVPKTIVLNLRDKVRQGFDYSENSTFAPSRTQITTHNDF
jgi:hypothetical protein